MELGFYLFCEAFITLHWTFFVFKPISQMIAEIRDKELFWVLFLLRVGILLYYDFTLVDKITGVFLVDFLSLFACAFLLVPLVAMITHTEYNRHSNQVIRKRNRVISDQNIYQRDRYNLGGYDHYGINNDGDYSNRVTLSNHSNEGVYMSREMNSTIQEVCTYCGEEVKSDFIYCPSCGKPIVSKMIQDTDGFN